MHLNPSLTVGLHIGVVCPVLGLRAPLPQAARTSPQRIAVCFMPDSIPRIASGTNRVPHEEQREREPTVRSVRRASARGRRVSGHAS